jgi:hypothetical protein
MKLKKEKENNRILQDHEKRISKLESLLLKSKSMKTSVAKKPLSDNILDLRDKDFFSQSRTVNETQSELKKIYQCEENRVSMALLRLANKKQLRKAVKEVDGQKYKAYVW